MQYLQTQTTTDLAALFDHVLGQIDALNQKVQANAPCLSLLADIEDSLQTLPLPADVFGVLGKRLQNANGYFASQEMGAGHYELKLMKGALRAMKASFQP